MSGFVTQELKDPNVRTQKHVGFELNQPRFPLPQTHDFSSVCFRVCDCDKEVILGEKKTKEEKVPKKPESTRAGCAVMVEVWWSLLGAAIPALVAGQALRMKRRHAEEERIKSVRGREKSSDEIFVCERSLMLALMPALALFASVNIKFQTGMIFALEDVRVNASSSLLLVYLSLETFSVFIFQRKSVFHQLVGYVLVLFALYFHLSANA
ncbi:hypothetical protein RJ641_010364 [Dillenia turbinata]|uniref:Uncharacterized protein n=1 Tax=Dillenia turbinata TaxID=194707 RepID=A0AAN8Z2L1_9MAGN